MQTKIRPEIQGLRAIAVVAVVIYHLWPAALPGGYAGVDVFFVISGFLISGLLIREAESTGGINLLAFYARRARRLLPAATLVLLLIAALTPVFLPASRWADTWAEVIAGALYIENWSLAVSAVDYLGAEQAPSPAQHFWSLSVEEQFYIFWPALIIAVLALSRAAKIPVRRVLRGVFALVTAALLVASIWLSAAEPASAYFVTHTRVWELSLGGLLATGLPIMHAQARRYLGLAGVAAIVAACFLLSDDTVFPGYAALLPTLGAAAIIAAGDSPLLLSAYSALKARPVQFLGDTSYSIYLWHWPLIVFFMPSGTGAETVIAGGMILLATLGLSAFSKRNVEDRFRHGLALPPLRQGAVFASFLITPLAASAAGLAVIASIAVGQNDVVNYPGAMALTANAPVPDVDAFKPRLARIARDLPLAQREGGCHISFEPVEPVPCWYGDVESDHKVLLIGDSHADHWTPAFEALAERRGWNAASMTKSSCTLVPVMTMRADQPYRECFEWGQRVRAIIAREKPDLVILSQMYNLTLAEDGEGSPDMQAVLHSIWTEIEATGARVAIIKDTPLWGEAPPCLSASPECATPYETVAHPDPIADAQASYPSVDILDFDDILCPDAMCPRVIGNVYVWRDHHHLTATFARTMADELGRRLDAAAEG